MKLATTALDCRSNRLNGKVSEMQAQMLNRISQQVFASLNDLHEPLDTMDAHRKGAEADSPKGTVDTALQLR